MPSDKKQPGPVHRRYDAYLIITIGIVFIVGGIIGVVRHAHDFVPFLLVCGVAALVAVTFILQKRDR